MTLCHRHEPSFAFFYNRFRDMVFLNKMYIATKVASLPKMSNVSQQCFLLEDVLRLVTQSGYHFTETRHRAFTFSKWSRNSNGTAIRSVEHSNYQSNLCLKTFETCIATTNCYKSASMLFCFQLFSTKKLLIEFLSF